MGHTLAQLAQQVQGRGLITPAGLLLPREDAVRLLSEPALSAVMVLGCQGWRTQDGEPSQIVRDEGAVYYVETQVPYIDIWPQLSADLVKRYLCEQFPTTCTWVSLIFEDATVAAHFATPQEHADTAPEPGAPFTPV